jgi:hypothetical protein
MGDDLTSPRLCGHCGVIVQMRVVAKHDEHPPEEVDEPGMMSARYGILQCLNCWEMSFTRYWWDHWDRSETAYGPPPREETLFPSAAAAPAGLPTDLVRIFEGSLKVRNVDADSYVTKVRKLLEAVCQRHQAAGRNLADQIDSLAASGKIPVELAKVAHKLRHFGNHGAHASIDEVPAEAVPVVEKLCAALLGYLYTMPLLVAEAERLLDAISASKPQRPASKG